MIENSEIHDSFFYEGAPEDFVEHCKKIDSRLLSSDPNVNPNFNKGDFGSGTYINFGDGNGTQKYNPQQLSSMGVKVLQMQHQVKFIKIHPDAKLPFKASLDAACSDVYSVENTIINPGVTVLVSTGLKVAHIPKGYKIEVYDRSGFGAKGIFLGNGVGQIDSDYRGELKVILYNSTEKDFDISIGDRIAQIALVKVEDVSYEFTEEFENTVRGEGGFGSTGT